MKKAIAYMMIGALAVTCASKYIDSNSHLACKMKKAGKKVMSMM